MSDVCGFLTTRLRHLPFAIFSRPHDQVDEPTLAAHDLAFVKRPPDGACYFWSAGTGLGTYALDSFDLLDLGNEDDFPLVFAYHPNAANLCHPMRADREAVADWLLEPENSYVLHCEYELWSDENAIRSYAQSFKALSTDSHAVGGECCIASPRLADLRV